MDIVTKRELPPNLNLKGSTLRRTPQMGFDPTGELSATEKQIMAIVLPLKSRPELLFKTLESLKNYYYD